MAERIHYKITGKLRQVRLDSSIVQLPQCSRTDSMLGEWEYSDIHGEMRPLPEPGYQIQTFYPLDQTIIFEISLSFPGLPWSPHPHFPNSRFPPLDQTIIFEISLSFPGPPTLISRFPVFPCAAHANEAVVEYRRG